MRLQKPILNKILSIFGSALLGAISSSCGAESPTPSESLGEHSSRSAMTPDHIYEEFTSCIIGSQLQIPTPAMSDSKSTCLQQSVAMCSAGAPAYELAQKCEKEFRERADRILRFGRQVECDSGACTILF